MKILKRDAILLLTLIILFLATFITVAMILLIKFNQGQVTEIAKEPDENSEILSAEPEYVYFDRLTGKGVNSEEEIMPRIAAVMINNNPDGYPVAGLNDAAVVYEAPVEGSFTRFMAIYKESDSPEKVGPVRSARPYYLDWLHEYGTALYMHCGGSSDALSAIKKQGIFDADEFSRTPYFWRDHSLVAPHNLFTSGEKWRDYFSDFSSRYDFGEWNGWLFGELDATSSEKNLGISYAYGKNFVVGWRYEVEKDCYIRTYNAEDFSDNNGSPVTADNVIIQFTTIRVLDAVGRRSIATVGEGEARVLRNGFMVRGSWKKESAAERTRFYDLNDEEIKLKSGKTWVMIVPKNAMLNLTN